MAAAEETLAALARDLADELAAAQAVELSGPAAVDQLELAVFNVRPFQRTQRVGKSGKVTHESVRGHPESVLGGEHFVAGDPSHMIHDTSEPEWVANEWKAHEAALSSWQKNQPSPSRKSPDKIAGDIEATRQRLPGKESFGEADRRLAAATTQSQPARAYRELALAHRHIRDTVLPQAQPGDYPGIAEHLQRISGHMQDLDQVMGKNPQATRKMLGTYRENFVHAGEARRTGEAVALAAQAREEAAQAQPAPPPPKTGAAAVLPHLGSRHVTALAGDTMSGTAHSHVPRPFDVPPPNPDQGRALKAEAAAQKTAEELDYQRGQQASVREEQHNAAVLERMGLPQPGQYQPMSDEEFTLHQHQVDDAVEKAFRDGQATDEAYTANGDGYTWEPDRASLHSDIVRDYLDKQADVPSQRHVLLLAGLPGAGKSTLMKTKGVDLHDYAVVSADAFKEELAHRGMIPEIAGLSPMEASTLVHEESKHLVNLVLAELEHRGKNIALEVTLNKEGQSKRMLGHFKNQGYTVSAILADIPAEVSADRAGKRYRSEMEAYRKGTNPIGGRYIPRYDLLKAEAEPGLTYPRRTFESLKDQFSHWERWDGTKTPPVLAEKSAAPGLTPSGGIPSAEELRKQTAPAGTLAQPFTGATEAQARARETGTPAT